MMSGINNANTTAFATSFSKETHGGCRQHLAEEKGGQPTTAFFLSGAVQQFRRLASEQNPNIQMVLPLAEIVGLLQQGVVNCCGRPGWS
jgi:hypothetical protein